MLMKAAADGASRGAGASSAVSRRGRQRKPRWQRARAPEAAWVMVEEARQAESNARVRGHHRRRLTSEDVHGLGIKMIFLQKKGNKRKRR